jgi:hypothetical protein
MGNAAVDSCSMHGKESEGIENFNLEPSMYEAASNIYTKG